MTVQDTRCCYKSWRQDAHPRAGTKSACFVPGLVLGTELQAEGQTCGNRPEAWAQKADEGQS